MLLDLAGVVAGFDTWLCTGGVICSMGYYGMGVDIMD
jgi:hypothetical protein